MPKVSMVGTFECQAGKNDEMDAALADQVAAVAEQEGVEVYSYHRGEGTSYSFFALFSSMGAMQEATQSDAMQAAMAGFGGLLAGTPVMMMATPVTAKGFGI